MNVKSWLLIGVAACLAAGCTTTSETPRIAPGNTVVQKRSLDDSGGFSRADVRAPNRYVVNVFPDDDPLLVIDHEPVRPLPIDNPVTIHWKLPTEDTNHNPSPYVFKDASDIAFLQNQTPPQPPVPMCTWVDKYHIRCKYDKPVSAVNWKYSIQVWKGSVPLVVLDPWVHQP